MFLEQHILGLVARFSDMIIDPRDEQSMIERERCIKAVEELVKVAKVHTRIARPQVCSLRVYWIFEYILMRQIALCLSPVSDSHQWPPNGGFLGVASNAHEP